MAVVNTPKTSREPGSPRRLLITAGPTHEPIDRVRYIGNRSSGQLGVAIAETAAAQTAAAIHPDVASKGGLGGDPAPVWTVTLLLGPTPLFPADSRVRVRRFLTTSDLQVALRDEVPDCDVLIMAAAVADYRPRPASGEHDGKIRRGEGALTIELEPTPDLLADVATFRRHDQLIVGFALEPRTRLLESARSKLVRKRLDLIVANPLETMDAPTIEATIVDATGPIFTAERPESKRDFAARLLRLIEARSSAEAEHR